MKKAILLIPLLGLLSACQVYGNDRLAEYRHLCTQHGYKVGTREFQRCMDEYEGRGKGQASSQAKVKIRNHD